jgi:cytoskeletal protein CcmA (bactofilin family)
MTIDANAFPNTGGLIVNQYLGVLGNIVVGQNLTVEGTATYSNLTVTGITANLTTANYITTTQNISANTAQFSGNVAVTKNISANTAQFSGNVAVTGNISALANLFVVGNLVISGNTYQSGNIIFTSPETLNFGPNSVVPKSYIDSALIIWGV